MSEQLAKSLLELIDETISEIETLKKSDGRFSAAEVNLKGPGEGIDGACVNGKLGKEEDKDEDDDHEESETAEEEAVEEEAKAKMKKKEEDEKKKKEDEEKAEMEKKEKDGINVEKKEKADVGYPEGAIKKSQEEMSTLMKSYVDERVKPMEAKIDSLVNLVQQIANQPVAQKSVSYKDIQPLNKSEETVTLSKAEVANKLFELKKSGTPVDSLDIAQAELASPATLQKIVAKYNIK